MEGPGRRVGYDNLTAIDWIYEYSKERTRIRQLTTNSPGVVGQLKLVADASQIWWILVATGLAVGGIAAGIDVASDWLGDVKQGICSDVEDGGKFYLNRAFCCWETNTYAECQDWRTWAKAMGISSTVGSYIIEYFFFVCFAVSIRPILVGITANKSRFSSPPVPVCWSTNTPFTPNRVASPRSKPCLVVSLFDTFWEHGR